LIFPALNETKLPLVFPPDLKGTLMVEAISEAHLAEKEGEVPIGALITDIEGKIISRAHNQVITLKDPTAHAEILAIREAGRTLGNYRLPEFFLFSTIEPCAMCLMAALHARLTGVIFGAPEPKWGAAGSLLDLGSLSGLNHHLDILEGGILKKECSVLLKEFFKAKRGHKPTPSS
jgi:tRNA(adenine34) deaminase